MSKGRAFVSVCRRWLSTTWKMSPALMYSLHFATAGLERGRLEVGVVRPRRLADRGHVGQLQVGDALLQPLDEPVHAVAGGLVAAAQVGRIDVGVGHGRDRLVDVVEDDHAVVEGEAEVGQAAVVGRRVRQAFDVAHGVVGGVADGAAAEARQAGNAAGRGRRPASPPAAAAGRDAPSRRPGRTPAGGRRGCRTPGSAGTGRRRRSCSGRAVRRRRRSRRGTPSRPPESCRRR